MSDIFWITGSDLSESQPTLAAALNNVGVLPGWVETAHMIADQIDQARAIAAGAFPITFLWPRHSGQTGFVLHDVCRSLLIREQNLALLAEQDQEAIHYALLASPQALGRYNLMPHAHIAAWWTLPPSALTALPQKLEKSGFDPELVRWISGEGGLGQNAIVTFPAAQPIEQGPDSLLGKLNFLIHRLDETKCSHGLLLSGLGGAPLLATLVER